MKLLLTGGTGFIGRPLCERLLQSGHALLIVSRRPGVHSARAGIRFLSWDGDEWRQALSQVDGVINLAGEPLVAKRWTPRQKARIRDSRVQTTHTLIEAMSQQGRRPAVFINASAVGYYGPRGDEAYDESASAGRGFLAEVCQAWEAEAERAQPLGLRVVRLRIGIVLAADGGALTKMVPPFWWFVGGPLGSGRQWMSWVHRDDVVGLIEWALGRPDVSGAVNATAPAAVTMREFCRTLGHVLRRPSWAPVPAPLLRLLLGEMADVLLTGQRVLPRAATEAGYQFRFPQLEPALRSTLTRSGGR